MVEHGSLVISGAMRAVFDAVSDGVAVFDAERKVVYLNRKAQELLGWSEPKVITHHGTLEDVFMSLTGRHLRDD